ncbi:MAG: TIM barrel protein [Anaerolineales bacterium]
MFKRCLATSPDKAKFAPLLYCGSLSGAMESAYRLGFDGLELNLRDSDQIAQEKVLADLSRLSLEVPSIGTGQSYFQDGLSLADPNPEVQQRVRERIKSHILFARRLGASVVLGSIRGRLDDSSSETREQCYQIAVEASRELARFAVEHGVRLTIEPINRYETNFLNTVAETVYFLDEVGEEGIGVLLDTFHMNIEESSMTEAVHAAGDRLWHVHWVDSNRCAPGMGHTDFRLLWQALEEVGYDGFLSAEILPRPDDEAAAATWSQNTKTMMEQY